MSKTFPQSIKERTRLQNEVLKEGLKVEVIVERVYVPNSGWEYTAHNIDYPEHQDYVYPTIGEAVEHIVWEMVEEKLREV